MTVPERRAPKPGPKRRTLEDGRRWYETEDGVFPSVTTILGILDKPALRPWIAKTERALTMMAAAALYEELAGVTALMSRPAYVATLERRIGKERAFQKELAKAATIGTEAHGLIEWNIRRELGQVVGAQPVVSAAASVAFAAYERWRSGVSLKVRGIEQVVWSKTCAYAGTLDVWADVDGVETVIDFKTGKAVYREAKLQIAAYAHALREMGHGNPVQGLVLRLPKTEADPAFEAVPVLDLPRYFRGFLHAVRMWHFIEADNAQEREQWKRGA